MGFNLTGHKISEFEDIDGSLQKSRGLLEVTVYRDPLKYVQNHLIPSFLLLTISNGVFWFPYIQPFITPRLALSILAMLSFVTISRRVESMLPATAPFTWNDLYNLNCVFLMFTTVVLNIFTEIVYHQLKCVELGKSMNNEIKVLWPVMAILSMSIVFSDTTGERLAGQGVGSSCALAGLSLAYTVYCLVRLPAALQKVLLKEAEAASTGK